MRLVYPDHEMIVDFIVPTLDEARAYIAEGVTNGLELLEAAGLSKAEMARLEAA